jgi:hypothetical protein
VANGAKEFSIPVQLDPLYGEISVCCDRAHCTVMWTPLFSHSQTRSKVNAYEAYSAVSASLE